MGKLTISMAMFNSYVVCQRVHNSVDKWLSHLFGPLAFRRPNLWAGWGKWSCTELPAPFGKVLGPKTISNNIKPLLHQSILERPPCWKSMEKPFFLQYDTFCSHLGLRVTNLTLLPGTWRNLVMQRWIIFLRLQRDQQFQALRATITGLLEFP